MGGTWRAEEGQNSPRELPFTQSEAAAGGVPVASTKAACFQEDATCVIISESIWRHCLESVSSTSAESGGNEASCVDQLLVFLGQALVITRHTLYVLFCVTPHQTGAAPTSPSPSPSNARSHTISNPCYEAAEVVSCSPEAWHFCVGLTAKLEALSQSLDLAVSPLVIPWGASSGEPLTDRHWALRARRAVLQHYQLTNPGGMWFSAKSEVAVACAVPLVLDSLHAFTNSEACDVWPRHCHVGLLQAAPTPATATAKAAEGGPILQQQQHEKQQQKPLCGVGGAPASSNATDYISGASCASPLFKYTVVAGTFDRLHGGHKVLLTAAALAANESVGLAVASGPLIEKKALNAQEGAASGIEPFAHRVQAASALLQLLALARDRKMCCSGFSEALQQEQCSKRAGAEPQQRHQTDMVAGNPSTACGGMETQALRISSDTSTIMNTACEASGSCMHLHLFRLTDPVGPADRLAFDCLVVSAETLTGGEAVNSIRAKLGNEPVALLSVELVSKGTQTNPRVVEVLRAVLPFVLDTERENAETDCVQGNAAKPVGATEEVSNKLSSTDLRHRQWMRLRCEPITWLCSRFRSCWSWLMGPETVLATHSDACTSLWHILCAEHAAPWRRLHTFDRVSRALIRLDEAQPTVNVEPVVLSLFLFSLLACPCRYTTLTTGPCNASNCDSRKTTKARHCACTVAAWSPNAEGDEWRRCARFLLTELQAKYPEVPPNPEKMERSRVQGGATGSSCCMLQGRYALLMGLLYEQRTASLATLALDVGSNLNFLKDSAAVAAYDVEDLVRLARRTEQLECTESSAAQEMRSNALREEYVFIDDKEFNEYRKRQLALALENTCSFDCLQSNERLRATANIKQELVKLGHASGARV